MAPETIGPSGLCVRVKGRRVKRQRESGAGSRVKGGAEHGGSRWQYGLLGGGVGGGWFVFGDGPGFNRDVRRDKDGTDRPGERSCCGTALCDPYSALSTKVSLPYPFLRLHLLMSDGCDQCCRVTTWRLVPGSLISFHQCEFHKFVALERVLDVFICIFVGPGPKRSRRKWFNYILERMKKTLKATVNWSEFLPEAERVQWN